MSTIPGLDATDQALLQIGDATTPNASDRILRFFSTSGRTDLVNSPWSGGANIVIRVPRMNGEMLLRERLIIDSIGDGSWIRADGLSGRVPLSVMPRSPVGSPEGLTLSRNASVPNSRLDITAGCAIVGGVVAELSTMTSNFPGAFLTKLLDTAWALGHSAGGRLDGTVGANQTWHVYLLRGVIANQADWIDVGFSQSATAPTMPTIGGRIWTRRMIGSIRTDSGGNILPFMQMGDYFWWDTTYSDFFSSATPTATTNLQGLTVPIGIRVRPIALIDMVHASTTSTLTSGSPEGAARAISVAHASTTNQYSRILTDQILTNTSGQVRLYASAANTTVNWQTQGFIHGRGAWG